jgi:hypothetical protein
MTWCDNPSMTDAHVSPDYCAHGVGIDRPCVDCERWYKEQIMSDSRVANVDPDVFADEYGFAYRVDREASTPRTPPTFDADGYPSDDTIACIEQWPLFPQSVIPAGEARRLRGARACLDFVVSAWNTTCGSVSYTLSIPELSLVQSQKDEQFIRFATGGWSGNEVLIAALRRNVIMQSMTWCLSARGGLHIYRVPK